MDLIMCTRKPRTAAFFTAVCVNQVMDMQSINVLLLLGYQVAISQQFVSNLVASNMWNKHVIHLPSLPLLCLRLSYQILPNPPPWVDCLHHFWFVSNCRHQCEFSFSRTAFIWQHCNIYYKNQERVLFAALLRSWNSPPCVLWAFLTWANVILDLRTLRIKPSSPGRGRFSKIISNSLNHHGSRKRCRFPLSERIYRLEARTQEKNPLLPPLLHQYRKQS